MIRLTTGRICSLKVGYAQFVVKEGEPLQGSCDLTRDLCYFSRLVPVGAAPIATTEAQEFFYVLQVYGI